MLNVCTGGLRMQQRYGGATWNIGEQNITAEIYELEENKINHICIVYIDWPVSLPRVRQASDQTQIGYMLTRQAIVYTCEKTWFIVSGTAELA